MEKRRPASIPYPNVWGRFDGKIKRENGKVLSYFIQDATEDMYEEIAEFLLEHFIPDAQLPRCLDIAHDKVSMDYLRQYYKRSLSENFSIVALLDAGENTRKIVGVNVLHAAFKNEKPDPVPVECKNIRLWFECIDYISKKVDPFQYYGVDEYVGARGLSVHRDFRGEGISYELLKARLEIGRALGFKVSVTIFTSIASQKMAERVGFEVLVEAPYTEYKHNGISIFDKTVTPTGKYMGIRL